MLDAMLDHSVLFSFDRTGFARHVGGADAVPERPLTGRDVLVTGGTAGIGLATAQAFAERGARVTVWGRDRARGAEALLALGEGAAFEAVDLGDLDTVARAAAAYHPEDLAGVVLNAGGMPWRRTLTPQGHELIWASQVLGHALLLRTLRARGLLGPESRVVWVSSGGMYLAPLDLRDLDRAGSYQRHTVYAQAKRAQVELCAALARAWPEVPQAAMHPGWVDTEAVRHSMPVFRALLRPLLRDAPMGADTVVHLVTRAEPWPSGRFWFDRTEIPSAPRGLPPTPTSAQDALWDLVRTTTEPWVQGVGSQTSPSPSPSLSV